MKTILINILLIIFLASCSQSKKLAKAKGILERPENREELAKMCHDNFPCQETIKYIKGEKIIDTVTRDREDIFIVDCPPSTSGTKIEYRYIIKDTIFNINIVDTIEKSIYDSAYHFIILQENRNLKTKNAILESKIKTKNKFIWILAMIAAVSVGLHVFRMLK